MCGILHVQVLMVAQLSPVQQLTTLSRYPTSQHPRSPCAAKCRRVSRDFCQLMSVDSRAYAIRYAVVVGPACIKLVCLTTYADSAAWCNTPSHASVQAIR
jgi:hypothetical protein